MGNEPRTIHLRRPAVLSVQAGVFVPSGAAGVLEEVDRRWDRLCAANAAYFDGRLYHVLGVHRNGHGGCTMHVIDCAYRFLAVQNDGLDLGVRALGIKGIVERDGLFLMGQRSMTVCAYPGLWEFAPAGGVEPGSDPAATIQHELREETGLQSAAEPVPVAVLFDPVLVCWEMVYRLRTVDRTPGPHTNEYTQLEWRSVHDPPGELSPIATQIVELIDLNRPHQRD